MALNPFAVCHLDLSANLALRRETGESSKFLPDTGGSKAVDFRVDATDITMHFATAPHTEDADPYWYVKLDDVYLVQTVEIFSRRNCCPGHMETIEVRVGRYHTRRRCTKKGEWKENPTYNHRDYK